MHRRRMQGGPRHQPRHCLPLPSPTVPCLVGSRPCGSCARLRVALRGEEESRPALALTFILGHVAVFTAPLPFARDSDGGCSNRSDIHASSVSGSGSVRVISSAISSDSRLVSGDISGLGSGDRRDSVGGTQSHARGGGSGQGAVFSALRNMKGRGRGGGRRLGSGRVRRCGISGRGRSRRREVICGALSRIRGRGSDEGRSSRCGRR